MVWERNRTRTVIQGKLEQTSNVHVTRDTFNDEVWMYRCYTLHIDTIVREYSNEVVVDAVGESMAANHFSALMTMGLQPLGARPHPALVHGHFPT